MMSGDMPRRDTPPMEGSPSRKLGNGRHSPTSPLKLFGQAKKEINDIYVGIGNYIDESHKFIQGVLTQRNDSLADVTNEGYILEPKLLDQVNDYVTKVKGIQEMLKRDRMKVAFFGRTSNGKSTVINAMLKNKILPSGIGHTTACFLQVEGTDGQDGFIMTEDNPTPRSVQNIRELAHALSTRQLRPNSLIRICWPKNKCNLLKDDVVLMDSPGVDVSPDLDTWIDKHCLDADVFVLVANAESTLMQTEKNFFHKVGEKLSKPNIFILNNRWDASASEPETMEETSQVRQQHLDRCTSFLADELKVISSKQEAENRVFFVSAREALINRAHQLQGTPTPSEPLEGWQVRLFEFCNFERKFEECISQSAVQTKFAQHTANGKWITSDLRTIMEGIYEKATSKKALSLQEHQEAKDKLDYTEKQLNLLTSEIKDKIKQMTEEVEKKVAAALTEEIRRLGILVDEFDRPFHSDSMILAVYKKELHYHLEEGISRNLHARCSGFVHQVLDSTSIEIRDRLTALLNQEAKQQVVNLIPNRDFEVAYRLDCRNLCADFHEDIEFRFSLGITSLMNRFLGPKGTARTLRGYSDVIPRPIASTPQTPSNEVFRPLPAHETDLMLAMLGTFGSLYSRTTVGAFAIAGVVSLPVGKAMGWRVIAICGAIYGSLYIYERLTWTNKAKERTFKRQYVDYATSKLKLIVDLTSSNCSHQVQQELSSTFARLSHQVDLAKDDLSEDLKRLKQAIRKLEEISTSSKCLKNKANYLDTELNSFIHTYLKPESQL